VPMRMVKNLLIFIAVLYIGFILFMPKQELYFKAESLLKKQGIVIDNEETQESFTNLKVLHPVAYYQGVDVARASIIKATPLLFTNKIEAENVELLNVAKKFLNVNINSITANESILKPYYIKLNIDANFGIATGYVNLKSKVIHIDIIEPKDINSIKKFLKKGEKGWYYESKF
jgi:hypothetical protein